MTEPLFLTSGDLIADRRYSFARDLIARGDLAAAADLLTQAVELVPRFASAWFALGEMREQLGDANGAATAFHEALAADPEDKHGATVRLARLGAVPGAMPRGYVRALFDQYAGRFDTALVRNLGYRGPDIVLEAIARACHAAGRGMKFGSVLDLGCGTGLAGAVLRPHADWLAGIDLSEKMIARARAKGLYDQLVAGDLRPFLSAQADDGAQHHLVAAADVFVYCEDLAPLAADAARILASDGLFAFTVETHDGDGVILRETLRFAHSESHVREALERARMRPLVLEPCSTRNEKDMPVQGLVAVAALAASPLSANARP
jgi:predicted TPR repeat methyltransferase